MARSLSEILSGIDTDKVSIDQDGHIASDDPDIEARLVELREALDVNSLATMDDNNGSMCKCTTRPTPIQSGCAQK
ncbi:hypothetical protein [Streptomyces sp. B1I3]|uniref:hypothetical protein n=1 Tax=Streptomyces sp. B1I3 TaxID=3042264 RepID=UPI0027882BDB|nr:hypothetical protein [Streptomyces sp. B1I3]MDQ0798301.1 hypothetical protein [Streptomyces sp. B1I3]